MRERERETKNKNPSKRRPSPKRICPVSISPSSWAHIWPRSRVLGLFPRDGTGSGVPSPLGGKSPAHVTGSRLLTASAYFKPGHSLLWDRKAFPKQHRFWGCSGPGAGSWREGSAPLLIPVLWGWLVLGQGWASAFYRTFLRMDFYVNPEGDQMQAANLQRFFFFLSKAAPAFSGAPAQAEKVPSNL